MSPQPGLQPSPTALARDSWTLASILAVGFVLFLVVAVLSQLLGLPWRSWLPGAEAERTLVGGVRASVYSFMSYLT